MTKPLLAKAEVALEFPDKLYIGTFDRTSRFDAHLDATGLSLVLERAGDVDTRKSVHMHLNYDLFSEILKDVAKTVSKIPQVILNIESRLPNRSPSCNARCPRIPKSKSEGMFACARIACAAPFPAGF